ncbi:AAA family ATPase [candidate division GN15 bacterium]|nr:AAA family ATPase [candidate division GN15 bacterium]
MNRRQDIEHRLERRLDLVGKEPEDRQPTMVSVLSGKGGVGKSVLALNLAERTSAMGHRTLLVDADLTSGNLHIMANLGSNDGMRRLIEGREQVVELVRPLATNLDLLTSSSGQPLEAFEDVKAVARLAARLRQQVADDETGYDVVLIDHGSGVSKAATVLASASDFSLLVLIPELTSISDCYGLYKHLTQTYDRIDCRLLLNRIESEEESDYVRTKFATVASRFLGRSPAFAGSIPEDVVVRQALARQQPIAQQAPESTVVQSLTSIARGLFNGSRRPRRTVSLKRINNNPAPADIRE